MRYARLDAERMRRWYESESGRRTGGCAWFDSLTDTQPHAHSDSSSHTHPEPGTCADADSDSDTNADSHPDSDTHSIATAFWRLCL